MIVLKDRVKQIASAPVPTGTLTLGTTPNSYRSFSSVLSSGDETYYAIETSNSFEVGIGRYGIEGSNTLTRDTVLSSSTGSKLSLTGRATVFITVPAAKFPFVDPSGELNLSLNTLSDVSLTTPASGESLKYNGSSWVNGVVAGYTTEEAQDAVGSILADTSSISFSYNDGTPSISASVKNSGITDVMIGGGVDALKIGSGNVSSTQFGYLNGVTSSLQTQLDSKYDSANPSGYLTSSVASATYLPLAGGTLTGDLKFIDATYDIGKSGATRPRDGFFSRDLTVGNKLYFGTYPNYITTAGGSVVVYSSNGVGNNATFSFDVTGSVTMTGPVVCGGVVMGGSVAILSRAGSGEITWSNNGPADLTVTPTSNILNQRNGTNAQTFRLAETWTSSTSFGALQFKANAGAAYQIGSAVGSAGGTNRAIDFGHWNSAGTFSSQLSLLTTGVLYSTNATSTAVLQTAGGNYIYGSFIGTPHLSLNGWWGLTQTSSGGISFGSGNKLVWGSATSNAPASGTSGDIGLARNAAGVLEVNTGTIGTLASITVGSETITQRVSTSGSPTAFTITGAAHTTLTASTEATDVNFNLSRTVQFAAGALTTQRAMRIQAPTYGFVGASTITTASTLSISGPPVAGTNATITNAYALNVESGRIGFTGGFGTGGIYFGGAGAYYAPHISSGSNQLVIAAQSQVDWIFSNSQYMQFYNGHISTNGSIQLGGATYSTGDINIIRDAAGVLATRNGTNAQTLRVYNTYTSATSFENLQFKANAGAAYQIGSAVGSAGGTNRGLWFGSWDSAGTFTSNLYLEPSGYASIGRQNYGSLLIGFSNSNYYDADSHIFRDSTTVISIATLTTAAATFTRPFVITQPVSTSGSPTAFTVTGAAHTTLTASTEASDVNLNLARTVQFATGALTTQRAMRIQAPTYSFVGASTITTASTLSISGPPVAGTNATITNKYALAIENNGILQLQNVSGYEVGVPRILISLGSPYVGLGNASFQVNGDGYCYSYAGFDVATTSSIGIQTHLITFQGGWGNIKRASPDLNGNGNHFSSAYNIGLIPTSGYGVQIINGTNANKLQVYTTFTSSTSYETLNIKGKASANFEIGPENGSAGGTLRGLTLGCYPAGTATIVGWAQFRPNTSTGALEAFYLGPIADSTAVGGNARGTNAVDLQISRTSASQVASGAGAFLAGRRGTASGSGSFCYGDDSAATAQFAVALGCFANATGYATLAIGVNAAASGSQSICISNGNVGSSATAQDAIAIGHGALADRTGIVTTANGRFAVNGDSQKINIVLRNRTTDATPVTLFSNGSSTRLTIPSGKIMFCDILISGIKSDGSASACYKRKVAIKNVGGTTALVGTVEAIGTDIEDNVLTDVTITADDTNDALQINVTGIAAETWRWVAIVEGLEIAYGT